MFDWPAMKHAAVRGSPRIAIRGLWAGFVERSGLARGTRMARRRCVGMLGAVVVAALAAGGCGPGRITADPVYFPAGGSEAHIVHIKSFNRLGELVRRRVGFLASIRGGVTGPSVGTPAGVAYRDGHLYVCDTEAGAIHDWDLATGQGRWLGVQGDVLLSRPVAVAVDGVGTVYVADRGRGEIVAFDSGGRVRRMKPGRGGEYKPAALATGGGRLYSADLGEHRIDVFDTADGRHLGSFGGVGSETGKMYYPMGVAIGGGGRVYVSDMMNGRVQAFGASWEAVLSMGKPGDRCGNMGKPRHLAVGPDGVVFVADMEFARVHVFNDRGQLLMLFGGDEDRSGGTLMPVGVAVAAAVPEAVASLVPEGFGARYFVFVTNTIGEKRISLYGVR